MKACKACGHVKPLDEFVGRKTAADGRGGNCKECHARIARNYRDAHPERETAAKRRHRQRYPEKHREHVKRNRAKNPEARKQRDARYRERHAERIASYGGMWVANNRERVREISRLGSSRRRARKAGGLAAVVPVAILDALKAAFDWRCAWCSAPRIEHIDHVYPLSKGGAHVVGNIVPSCGRCNRKKHNRDPRKWAERCGVSLEAILAKANVVIAPDGPKGNENAV